MSLLCGIGYRKSTIHGYSPMRTRVGRAVTSSQRAQESGQGDSDTPMWFLPYAGLTAAPMALTLGGALAVLLWWSRSVRWLPPTLVGIAKVGILVLAHPMRDVAGDRGG